MSNLSEWIKTCDELEARCNELKAENARLKTEVEHLMVFCNCTLIPNKELQAENARLKAEVERLDTLCKQLGKQHSDISCENIMLRKAGDAMAKVIDDDYLDTLQVWIDWNAAKEGKPSV
jgi:predicted nuclease with TOPRIM domain